MLSRRDAPPLSAGRAGDDSAPSASPPAMRSRRRRWSDPRLWLGAVLVLGSVVAGAKLVAPADDSVAVWQLTQDVPAGSSVGRIDLRVTQVHFDESSAARQYLLASAPIPSGARASRDLQAGELLSVSAVTTAPSVMTRQLPLGVGPAHAPADLRSGDHVDVWAVPAEEAGDRAAAPSPARVLHDVVVLSVSGDLAGVSGDRQILVGVGPQVDIGTVLRETVGSQVVLVRLAS